MTQILEINRSAPELAKPVWLDLIHDQIASIRFGTVLITVHDSRVVQVEKNEKVRLDLASSSSITGSAPLRGAPRQTTD